MELTYIPPLFGVIGLVAAFVIYLMVMRYPAGEAAVVKIAEQIHVGAMVFMRREYTMLALFAGVLVLLLYFSELGPDTAIAFLIGALSSAGAGWIGMYAATQANVRTTTAAHTVKALRPRCRLPSSAAPSWGSRWRRLACWVWVWRTTSLVVTRTPRIIFTASAWAPRPWPCSPGSAVVSTPRAPTSGADLVGKLEAGIPEDDPRNPGVIADNVGDNVGDVAGMGSDIFESYCGSMIATIAIASTLAVAGVGGLTVGLSEADGRAALMFLPLAMASTGLICSLIGIAIVRSRSSSAPALALRIGMMITPLMFIGAAWFVIQEIGISSGVWWSVLAGAVGGVIIGLVTEYYTSSTPVVRIAESGKTGAATVMITGLAVGMQSVVIPVLAICASSSFQPAWRALRRRHRRGRSAGHRRDDHGCGRLRSGRGQRRRHRRNGRSRAEETRAITDSLDELGNTTAAMGKGFAIGAAALAALAIIAAFVETIAFESGRGIRPAHRRPGRADRYVHRRFDSVSHRFDHHDRGR